MNQPHDPNGTIDIPSDPADDLDAGLAAGFGRPAVAPRSSLGDLRPVLLKEAEGESAHLVKPKSDAMPSPEQTGDRYQLQGEIARGGMGAVLRGHDVDLGRDLAVKVLLEEYVDRPEDSSRKRRSAGSCSSPADRAMVRRMMKHWQTDTDGACIRDKDALAKLPAEERAAWEKLWADVAALLKQAETPVDEET